MRGVIEIDLISLPTWGYCFSSFFTVLFAVSEINVLVMFTVYRAFICSSDNDVRVLESHV